MQSWYNTFQGSLADQVDFDFLHGISFPGTPGLSVLCEHQQQGLNYEVQLWRTRHTSKTIGSHETPTKFHLSKYV